MIDGGTKENRFVIPRWLTYKAAQASGELAMPANRNIVFGNSFARQFAVFHANPTQALAAELLGIAFLDHRPEGTELAKFVLQNPAVREPTVELARTVIGITPQGAKKDSGFAAQIRLLKLDVRRLPKNPMKWVDLGRLYAASGQVPPALRALRVAVALAPTDRFCLRALCRFYFHIGDYAAACEMFEGKSDLLGDPWLLASAASAAGLAEKPSPLPRKLSVESTSPIKAFHRSELLEAFGVAELENGKDRVARRTLRAAWLQPSANVVTHAQWVTSHVLPGLRDEARLDLSLSFQASAHESLENGNIRGLEHFLQLWKQEEPYSEIPYILESYVYSIFEEFDKVITTYDTARTQGLVGPLLLNNCVVALICKGDLAAAGELFHQEINHSYALPLHTFKATSGLFELAAGRNAAGIALYDEAEEAADRESGEVSNHVFLNKILAMYRFNYGVEKKLTKRVDSIREKATRFPVKQLLRNIDAWSAKRHKKQVAGDLR